MNLRDQLLKSGLVSKERVKHAERAVSKSRHKEDLEIRSKAADAKLIEAENREAEQARIQAEKTELEREESFRRAQVETIILRGEIKDSSARGTYYFTLSNGQIESIAVNEIQAMHLASGELAVAFLENEQRYVILSRKNAEKAMLHDPSCIVCFHGKKSN